MKKRIKIWVMIGLAAIICTIIVCLFMLFMSRHKIGKPEPTAIDDKYITNMHTEEIIIPGLKHNYEFLYISDTHIPLANSSDDLKIQEYAKERQSLFVNSEGTPTNEIFPNWIQIANKRKVDALLMGGDIIDSPSNANIDFLKANLSDLKVPYLYTEGNHDYTYPWDYFNEKSKDEYLPKLKPFMEGNTEYHTLDFDEFMIISINNSENQISEKALEGLMHNINSNSNKPIILLLHVPLEPQTSDGSLIEESINVWGPTQEGKSKVVLGANGITPNDVSMKFTDTILKKDNPVVAVLAGHVHFKHRALLNNKIIQIVSAASYTGEGTLITIKGN